MTPAVAADPGATELARNPRASCMPVADEGITANTSPFESVATGPLSSPQAATTAEAAQSCPVPKAGVDAEQASATYRPLVSVVGMPSGERPEKKNLPADDAAGTAPALYGPLAVNVVATAPRAIISNSPVLSGKAFVHEIAVHP